MTVSKLPDRKYELRTATPGAYVKQRIGDAASELSLAGTLAARVEFCNEALARLVMLVYEPDTDRTAANVDIVTKRILIPLPWGSAGWKRWGLRYHEAIVLRTILLHRQAHYKVGALPPLFVYDADQRSWHLNAEDYRGLDAGMGWLSASEITVNEWKRYLRQWRDGVVTVKKRQRNGM